MPQADRIDDDKIRTCQRLLRTTLPITEIALILDLSRETIHAIKRGDILASTSRYKRCPGCGGKAIQPCILCTARATLAEACPLPPSPS
ncbi:MAG: hypothetical protein SFX18_12235 [Pirellulales bacterium]|nr:hypothetical protein [Pirellulales bacterium]